MSNDLQKEFRRIIIGLALYYAGGTLSGAWYWNHVADQDNLAAQMDTIVVGIGWPIYWITRLALKVTA